MITKEDKTFLINGLFLRTAIQYIENASAFLSSIDDKEFGFSINTLKSALTTIDSTSKKLGY